MSGTTSNDFIDLRGLGKGTSKVKYDIVKDAKTNFATVAVYIDNNSSTDLNILLQNVVYNTDLRNQIKNFVLV